MSRKENVYKIFWAREKLFVLKLLAKNKQKNKKTFTTVANTRQTVEHGLSSYLLFFSIEITISH